MNESKTLTENELSNIKMLKQSLQLIDMQKKITELDLQNYILRIYVKYQLSETDTINESSGLITKNS